MEQINYILRDDAGGMRRGEIDAEPGAYELPARAGQRLSLNLRQADVKTYVRQGGDLVLSLIDGRQLRLESFFDAGEAGVRLYLSTSGFLNEIRFAVEEEGPLTAHFGPTAQAGRSSLSDMLMHDGPGGLIEGAVAEQAVVPDVSQPPVPEAAPQGDIKVLVHASGVDLSGRARPGSIVDVSFAGVTHTLRVSARGTWIADFTRAQLPKGSFTGQATVTETEIGGARSTYACTLTVNVPEPLPEVSAPVGDAFAVSEAGVLSIAGQAEPGHAVDVLMGDIAAEVILGENGDWEARFAVDAFEEGLTDLEMSATATDMSGLGETATQPVLLWRRGGDLSVYLRADLPADDAVPEIEEPLVQNTVPTAPVLRDVAPEDGVALTGSTDPFAQVTLSVNGTTRGGQADAQGDWQIVFAHTELPPGRYTARITATVTGADGSPSSASETVEVDLRAQDAEANPADEGAGIELAGQVEPGSRVDILFAGRSFAAEVDSAGNWVAAIPREAITQGNYRADVTVRATDPRGHVARITETLDIDTDAPDGPVISARNAA